MKKNLDEPKEIEQIFCKKDYSTFFNELKISGDLKVKLLISPETNGKFLLTGTLSGKQNLTCSRTLEEFERPFSCEMVLEIERIGIASQRLDDEDPDVFAYQIPLNQEFIDISESVRQLVILQEPQNPVKNPEEDFIFVSDKPTNEDSTTDPRWDKLKALKSKMENRS